MLKKIQRFFVEFIQADGGAEDSASREERLRRATAALLMEMVRADFHSGRDERQTVRALLQAHFALDDVDADALLDLGEEEAREATSLFQFTQLIDQSFEQPDKEKVVEMLWRVAYADQNLDKYEEYLMRKVSDLLHVPHSRMMQAKHRVQAELE